MAAQVWVTSRKPVHDTGKGDPEPLPHRGRRVRGRCFGAEAEREPELTRGEAAEPRTAQPALPSSASEPARCAGSLGRSPERQGPPAPGIRSAPNPPSAAAALGRPPWVGAAAAPQQSSAAAECPTSAPRPERAAAVSPERGRPWGCCPRARR